MINLIGLKILVAFFLVLMLVDSTFAGFVPNSFTANFEQIIKSKRRNGADRIIPMKVKYLYPKNFHMVSKQDKGKVYYICNPKKVWVYTPAFIKGAKNEVRIGDSSKYCYSKAFDLLKVDLKTNKRFKVNKLSDKSLELIINKKLVSELGYDKIVLDFKSKMINIKNLNHFKIYFLGYKKPVVLTVKGIQVNAKISPKEFNFKVPENTERIQMKK